MAKNRILKDRDMFGDFSQMMDAPFPDEMMNSILGNLVEASHHQMQIAVELTRLIVDKGSPTKLNEDGVLAIFKQALSTVADQSPLKQLWGKLG